MVFQASAWTAAPGVPNSARKICATECLICNARIQSLWSVSYIVQYYRTLYISLLETICKYFTTDSHSLLWKLVLILLVLIYVTCMSFIKVQWLVQSVFIILWFSLEPKPRVYLSDLFVDCPLDSIVVVNVFFPVFKRAHCSLVHPFRLLFVSVYTKSIFILLQL